MTSALRVGFLAAITFALPAQAQVDDPGRLYGRVVTLDRETFEGFLSWDGNEAHWTDHIDATKRVPRRFRREAERLTGERYERERSVRVFGVRVGWGTESQWSSTSQAAIRFGHVQRLEVLDDNHALLTLKSGEEQELTNRGSDLGRGLDVIVHEADGSSVEIGWDDIDTIEFLPAPRGESGFGERIHGTLTARGGYEFTGWITWDRDEIFGLDELDGDEGRRRHQIPFSNVRSIERVSSSRALVTTADGDRLELDGTNDVNSGNRGIFVSDPGLGRVEVKWREFESLRLHPPENPNYQAFDGGRRITGTVTTETGERISGDIRWDNDEEWTWEALDGNVDGMIMDVEFGLVGSVERVSPSSSRVTLRDGRSFVLRGSNDVDDDNKGIFVYPEGGEPVMLMWDEVARVDFSG